MNRPNAQIAIEDAAFFNRESIPRQIFSHLWKAIANAEIKPGDRMREGVLAKKLNVSQSSVREAIQILGHYGLVTREPNRGARVTDLSPEEVVERLRVRTVLESYAMLEAKRRITPEGLGVLRQKLETFERSIESDDRLQIGHVDFEFHRTIWHLSGNKTLEATLVQVLLPLSFFGYQSSVYDGGFAALVDSHKPLLKALEKGSEESAQEAIRRHISEGWAPVIGKFQD